MAIAMNPDFNWWRFGGEAAQDLGYGLANSSTVGNAFGAATRYGAAQQPYRDQQATLAEQRRQDALEKNQTSEWIKANFPQYGNLPTAQGFQLAMNDLQAQRNASGPSMTSDIQNYEYGLAHPGFTDWQTQRGGNSEISLTPTWGIDTDKNSPTFGQPVLGQLGKDNKFHRTEMNGVQPIDPATMQGNKTTTTVDAKTSAAARAALPGAQQALDIANKATAALLNNTAGMAEQFGNTMGVPNQYIPDWAMAKGSPMANFRTALQQGQGQAFMQARNMLKGGGPITDFEGAKAEAAFSRMTLAAQNNNQQEFVQAVQDFQQAVNEGYQKLVDAANGQYAAGQPAVTGASGGNTTSTGIQWSVSP